jgi:hypothetical protein
VAGTKPTKLPQKASCWSLTRAVRAAARAAGAARPEARGRQGRRRAVVPGFHNAWLAQMVRMFAACADEMTSSLDALGEGGAPVNLEVFAAARPRTLPGRCAT